MDPVSIIVSVVCAVIGYWIRHRQGDPAPATPGPSQPSPATPQPSPALPGVELPAELLAIIRRPAAQALLHMLAVRAASTPTQVDDLLVQMALKLSVLPAQPAQPSPK